MLHDVFVAEAIAGRMRFDIERAAAGDGWRAAQEAMRVSRRERRVARMERLALHRRRPNRSSFPSVSVNPWPTT